MNLNRWFCRQTLNILTVLALVPVASHAGVYSFGNGCASLGSWSQAALAQTQAIKGIIESLKDDPNCKGIETILPKIQVAQDALNTPEGEMARADRFETIPNELAALRNFAVSSPEMKSEVLKLMTARKLEMASLTAETTAVAAGTTAAPGIAEIAGAVAAPEAAAAMAIAQGLKDLGVRSRRSLQMGLDMLDQSLDILPNLDRCLVNAPSQGLALVAASVKLTAAFASSQDGMVNRMGNTVAKLVTFLRDKKFTNALARLDENEFWMSLSCLIETTSQTYCAARDSHRLLDFGLREMRPKANANSDAVDIANPLAGYYVLTRDVPKVSAWIQKIQFGIEPKLATDAAFKNKVWTDVTDLMKTINGLRGIYNENLLTYSALPDQESRRTTILKLIGTLTGLMAKGDYNGEGSASTMNFFTQSITGSMIPFRLVGLPEIPEECTAGRGGEAMEWNEWMLNRGKWQTMFHSPDELIRLIGLKLEELIKLAVDRASIYFQQRMIVDMSNLVNESVTSQAHTVVQSFKRISSYLTKLEEKILATHNDESIILVPSIRDTRVRIELVLQSYNAIREAILAGGEPQLMDTALKDAYKAVIETTYSQFNVLLQRDTFLPTRLSTFIHHDYAIRIRGNDDLTQYEKELMIETGNELLFRLLAVTGNNPTQVKNDLETALVLNKRNLQAVESIFRDNLKEIIGELEYIASGAGTVEVPTYVKTFEKYKKEGVSSNRNFFSNAWGYVWAFSSTMGENATYLPWLRSSVHSEVYNYKPKNDVAIRSADDEFGSFAQLKAKFCAQSLAFEDRMHYHSLCRGAVLKSDFDVVQTNDDGEEINIPLDLYYDSYMRPNMRNKPVTSDSICAFQTYSRRNLVYWLTQDAGNGN